MNVRGLRALVILGLLLGAGCRSALEQWPAPPSRYRIVAYVRGSADIYRVSAWKLTHVNYAFATVSPEGDIVLRDPESPAHLAQIQALKAANPRLKVLVSVGGWGAGNFSEAALTDESRARFAASGIDLVRRFALDGIDLDWEYPGQAGPGISYRPEDKENFTLMLRSLREHLDALGRQRGRRGEHAYLLTIASSAGVYFRHTEMDRLHRWLDFINIMTYDFAGSWSATTGHHTALYRDPAAPGSWASTADFVEQHLAAGIPPDKIVVGVAFYGRGWTGVSRANDGLYQPWESALGQGNGWSKLARLPGRDGFRRIWDPVAKAPYLWNDQSGTFITYDDPESLIEKTRYIRQLGLGGVMYWEHSHDPEETLLDVLYYNLRR